MVKSMPVLAPVVRSQTAAPSACGRGHIAKQVDIEPAGPARAGTDAVSPCRPPAESTPLLTVTRPFTPYGVDRRAVGGRDWSRRH